MRAAPCIVASPIHHPVLDIVQKEEHRSIESTLARDLTTALKTQERHELKKYEQEYLMLILEAWKRLDRNRLDCDVHPLGVDETVQLRSGHYAKAFG